MKQEHCFILAVKSHNSCQEKCPTFTVRFSKALIPRLSMASAARWSLWVSSAMASLKGIGTFFLKTLVVSFCNVASIWVSPGCSWKPCRSSAAFLWPALVSSRDALSAVLFPSLLWICVLSRWRCCENQVNIMDTRSNSRLGCVLTTVVAKAIWRIVGPNTWKHLHLSKSRIVSFGGERAWLAGLLKESKHRRAVAHQWAANLQDVCTAKRLFMPRIVI